MSDTNSVDTLDAGTVLRVVEDCTVEDADGNQWVRVRDEATSRTGYVSADFVEPQHQRRVNSRLNLASELIYCQTPGALPGVYLARLLTDAGGAPGRIRSSTRDDEGGSIKPQEVPSWSRPFSTSHHVR